jgi:hypothetical protein
MVGMKLWISFNTSMEFRRTSKRMTGRLEVRGIRGEMVGMCQWYRNGCFEDHVALGRN